MAIETTIYTPRTLGKLVRRMPPVHTFFRDTFFKNRQTFNTKSVDVDFKKGSRALAPFVHPKVGGKTILNTGYQTKTYTPVLLAPNKITTVDDLLERAAGEDPYSGRKPAERAVEKLAEDLRELNEMIVRREEWMAATAIFTGQIPIVGEGVNEVIDFSFTNKETIVTAEKKWDNAQSDPLADIERWHEIVQREGFVNCNICIMAKDVATAFVNHEKVKSVLDVKAYDLAVIRPRLLPNGVTYELADYIERKILDEDRSPAAALADIKLEGKAFKTSICVSTLYSYITKGVFLSLTNADLPEKPKRKRPYRTVKKTGKRQNGKSIDKRPEEVDQRTTFGHWEGDTVYSKKDGSKALLVLTERLTRWEIIARIKDRTANSVIKALDKIERRFGADLFAKAFQTITFDNGGEFSDVERLERSAVRKGRRRTTAYFCHPYSSYERGSNECQNKMIRRKFPKGTDFGAVSAAAVKRAEDWINNYPREILGWKTAEICFRECLAALA